MKRIKRQQTLPWSGPIREILAESNIPFPDPSSPVNLGTFILQPDQVFPQKTASDPVKYSPTHRITSPEKTVLDPLTTPERAGASESLVPPSALGAFPPAGVVNGPSMEQTNIFFRIDDSFRKMIEETEYNNIAGEGSAPQEILRPPEESDSIEIQPTSLDKKDDPAPSSEETKQKCDEISYTRYLYPLLARLLTKSSEFRDNFTVALKQKPFTKKNQEKNENKEITRKLCLTLTEDGENTHNSALDRDPNADDGLGEGVDEIIICPRKLLHVQDMRKVAGKSFYKTREQGIRHLRLGKNISVETTLAHEFLHYIRDLYDREGLIFDKDKPSKKFTNGEEKRCIQALHIIEKQMGLLNRQISHFSYSGGLSKDFSQTPLIRFDETPSKEEGIELEHLTQTMENGYSAEGHIRHIDQKKIGLELTRNSNWHWYNTQDIKSMGYLRLMKHAMTEKYPIEISIKDHELNLIDRGKTFERAIQIIDSTFYNIGYPLQKFLDPRLKENFQGTARVIEIKKRSAKVYGIPNRDEKLTFRPKLSTMLIPYEDFLYKDLLESTHTSPVDSQTLNRTYHLPDFLKLAKQPGNILQIDSDETACVRPANFSKAKAKETWTPCNLIEELQNGSITITIDSQDFKQRITDGQNFIYLNPHQGAVKDDSLPKDDLSYRIDAKDLMVLTKITPKNLEQANGKSFIFELINDKMEVIPVNQCTSSNRQILR